MVAPMDSKQPPNSPDSDNKQEPSGESCTEEDWFRMAREDGMEPLPSPSTDKEGSHTEEFEISFVRAIPPLRAVPSQGSPEPTEPSGES